MAQAFTDDVFAAGHAGLTDMQNVEDNFQALKSSFSGASAPSDAVAGMPWFHTTNKILKVRNNANDAWRGVMYGSVAFKTWVYLNAAEDGWVIDATVTDRVLSLKGGAQAYNANGGTNAGTWTYAGLTNGNASVDHTHTGPSHTHTLTVDANHLEGTGGWISVVTGGTGSAGTGATGGQSVTHTHTISSDATHRPAAAIGTLQYPNI